MTRRRRAVFFVVALLPTFLLLVLAELGLRWYEHSRIQAHMADDPEFWQASTLIHRESGDSTLIYELVPGSVAVREGVRIRINSSGFRDDEFPPAGVPTGRRIVVLGDSVAFGWGVPMEAAFPQLLERRLRAGQENGEPADVVLNLSVDGYSTEQELRLLEVRGLALKPDLVILDYVLNDPDTADGGLARYYRSELMLWRLVGRSWARGRRALGGNRDIEEYHHRIHADHADRVRAHFERLGRISVEHGFPIMVAITPVFEFPPEEPYPWRDLHDSIRRLCERNGLHCIDLLSSFESRDLSDLSFDHWHPNEEGHAIIAEALAARLKVLRGE